MRLDAVPAAARAILGSYGLHARFDSYGPKTKTAGVQFTLNDPMTRASATLDARAARYQKGESNPLMAKISEVGLDFAPRGQEDAAMTVRWGDQIKMTYPLKTK